MTDQPTPFENWTRDHDGNLILNPMSGVSTCTIVNGSNGVLRLEYMVSDNLLEEGSLQFSMTLPQAYELIRMCQAMASRMIDRIEQDRAKSTLN